jgi:hypothetical protein
MPLIGGIREMRPLGLKPWLIFRSLRGAEAPLFHVTGHGTLLPHGVNWPIGCVLI